MPIYLIQHITHNEIAISLAVAFYTKLQLIFSDKFINCWVSTEKNSVFFLIKATDKKFIKHLYFKAPNLCPYKIALVNSHLAYAFLKTTQKLKKTQSKSLLKTTKQSVVFIAKILNKRFHQSKYEKLSEKEDLLRKKAIIENSISSYDGSQVDNGEDEVIIASFNSSKTAITCASSVLEVLSERAENIPLKIIIHPFVTENAGLIPVKLIPVLINAIHYIKTEKKIIFIPNKENEPSFSNGGINIYRLSFDDKSFLFNLINVLSENYHKPKFNTVDICRLMMMCKTKLYRKSKAITGSSINQILKEFRLLSSVDSMKTNSSNIGQISTDVGFSSNSYFSNCFKKKFGISPKELLKKRQVMTLTY